MILTASRLSKLGEYDEIDTDDLLDENLEILKPTLIKKFGSSIDIPVKFKFSLDGEKLALNAICEDLKIEKSVPVDGQTLVNEVSISWEDAAGNLFDEVGYVIDLKNSLISLCSEDMVRAGNLAINCPYNAFGYIKQEQEVIGTFEGIELITENSLHLSEVQSFNELKDMKNFRIEFYLYGKLFTVNISRANGDTLICSSVNFEEKEIPEEFQVKAKNDYASYEEFLDDRKKLLNNLTVAVETEDSFDFY